MSGPLYVTPGFTSSDDQAWDARPKSDTAGHDLRLPSEGGVHANMEGVKHSMIPKGAK